MTKDEKRQKLAQLRAELTRERKTPDRNACYAREIEAQIEALVDDTEEPEKEDKPT